MFEVSYPKCPVCGGDKARELGDGFYHCPFCDHVWVWPPDVKVSYDDDYLKDRYDKYETTPHMSHLRLGMLSPFVTNNEAKILDIGYGNGDFLNTVVKLGWSVYGCDIHGRDCGFPNITLKEAARHDWDVVTAFDSIEHFTDFSELEFLFFSLASRNEYQRRKSTVLITIPDRPSWYPWNKDKREFWRHHRPGEHLHHFSEYSLSCLIGSKPIFNTQVESVIRGFACPKEKCGVTSYIFFT